jgi:hypothetical protein
MSEFSSKIKGVTDSEHATGALYILLIGLALSDVIPTPADYFVFQRQRTLRDQYINGEITPAQYWQKTAFAYYTYNFLFWIIVGVIIICVGGDFGTKTKVLIGIVGIGAVAVILYKNIKKDELAKAMAAESLIPKQ